MPWYATTGPKWLLRPAGAGLLALAYLMTTSLRARAIAGALERDPVAYLLAAGAFLSASGGAVLTLLGAHIFARVRVSRRWRATNAIEGGKASGRRRAGVEMASQSGPSE